MLEVDQRRRGDPEQLAQQKLLALPDRHREHFRAPRAAQPVEDRPGARPHLDDARAARLDQRADDVGVHAVLEAIPQQRRKVLLAGQPQVIGHEHAVRREPAQFVAIRVAERIGVEQTIGDLAGAARALLGDDLTEVLEQEVIPLAGRPAGRIEDAARVADRVVVACRRLIGRLRDQDELVPGIDQRPLGAAADRTALGRQPLAAFGIGKRLLVANLAPHRGFVIACVHRNRAPGQPPLGALVGTRDTRHPPELMVVLQQS